MSDPMTTYTIISRENYKCPWCDKAAEVLDEKGLPYSLRKLPSDDLKVVAAESGMNTIPIIFKGLELIGGYDDLIQHLAD